MSYKNNVKKLFHIKSFFLSCQKYASGNRKSYKFVKRPSQSEDTECTKKAYKFKYRNLQSSSTEVKNH